MTPDGCLEMLMLNTSTHLPALRCRIDARSPRGGNTSWITAVVGTPWNSESQLELPMYCAPNEAANLTLSVYGECYCTNSSKKEIAGVLILSMGDLRQCELSENADQLVLWITPEMLSVVAFSSIAQRVEQLIVLADGGYDPCLLSRFTHLRVFRDNVYPHTSIPRFCDPALITALSLRGGVRLSDVDSLSDMRHLVDLDLERTRCNLPRMSLLPSSITSIALPVGISGECYRDLSERLPALRSIRLVSPGKVSWNDLESFALITDLSLSHVTSIGGASESTWQNLSSLSLTSVGDSAGCELPVDMPALEHLSCKYSVVSNITQGMSSPAISTFCAPINITNRDLSSVCSRHTTLRQLHFFGCDNLTTLEVLSQQSRLDGLTVWNCNRVQLTDHHRFRRTVRSLTANFEGAASFAISIVKDREGVLLDISTKLIADVKMLLEHPWSKPISLRVECREGANVIVNTTVDLDRYRELAILGVDVQSFECKGHVPIHLECGVHGAISSEMVQRMAEVPTLALSQSSSNDGVTEALREVSGAFQGRDLVVIDRNASHKLNFLGVESIQRFNMVQSGTDLGRNRTRRISLACDADLGKIDVRRLHGVQLVESLEIHGCPSVRGLESIDEMPALSRIDIRGSNIEIPTHACNREYSGVESIACENTVVNEWLRCALGSCTRRLHFRECDVMLCSTWMDSAVNVEYLAIRRCSVTNFEAVESLKGLRYCLLDRVAPPQLSVLESLKRLRSVHIIGVDERDCEYIAERLRSNGCTVAFSRR